ncbi:TetR/AcrR family transcriptional regulator [Myxococcus xanthus]|uniref:TetR/AcrR family transcriptional regulator n=1 Tax=Myxococcus xanthus TaxID=34 RepID=UPI001375F719|nr:TetR/AcrR family transcriptional regulator [Myxococcus xanthus]
MSAAARAFAVDPSAPLVDVARSAGVGRATLHRYFGSREELLREAGLDSLVQLEQALKAHRFARQAADVALESLVGALAPWGDRLRFLLVVSELSQEPSLKDTEARVDEQIMRILLRARDEGVLRQDLPSAWLFATFEALLYAAWTAVAQGDLAANDAARTLHETLLHGHGTGHLAGARKARPR